MVLLILILFLLSVNGLQTAVRTSVTNILGTSYNYFLADEEVIGHVYNI